MNELLHPEIMPPAVNSVRRDRFAVSGSDIFALGHYPGNPIYPGVLIAERLCRLADALATDEAGRTATARRIKRIQYLDAVLPGDLVDLVVSIKKQTEEWIEVAASAWVGEKQKTRATILCSSTARTAAQTGGDQPALPGVLAIPHRQLTTLLPHRYPFLLLDTVEDFVPGQWLRARKVANRYSPLFLDQLPTSYPQSLVIESVGQAGIALFFLSRQSEAPADIVLGSIGEAEFLADVPFDVALTIDARIERMLANGVVFSGEARIGEQVVTRLGSLTAMLDPR